MPLVAPFQKSGLFPLPVPICSCVLYYKLLAIGDRKPAHHPPPLSMWLVNRGALNLVLLLIDKDIRHVAILSQSCWVIAQEYV